MKFMHSFLIGVSALILSPVASSAATLSFNAPLSGNTTEEATFSFDLSEAIAPTQDGSSEFALPVYLYGNTSLNIETASGIRSIEGLNVSVSPALQQFELSYLNSNDPTTLGLTTDFQGLYQDQDDLPDSSDVIDILTNSEGVIFNFFSPDLGSAGPDLVYVDTAGGPAVIPAPASAILLFSGMAGLFGFRRRIAVQGRCCAKG